MRTIGNRVRVTPPRVRIPPSPPAQAIRRRWKVTCGVFLLPSLERCRPKPTTLPPASPTTGHTSHWSGAPVACRWSISHGQTELQPAQGVMDQGPSPRLPAHPAGAATGKALLPHSLIGWTYTKSASGPRRMRCPHATWARDARIPNGPSPEGVLETRLPYRSVSPRNEALAQLQNSQLSEVITGFH